MSPVSGQTQNWVAPLPPLCLHPSLPLPTPPLPEALTLLPSHATTSEHCSLGTLGRSGARGAAWQDLGALMWVLTHTAKAEAWGSFLKRGSPDAPSRPAVHPALKSHTAKRPGCSFRGEPNTNSGGRSSRLRTAPGAAFVAHSGTPVISS